MHTREFPVLADEDSDVVDALAVGLDRDTARVLAYLLLRAEEGHDAPASRLAIRIGTELGRERAAGALKTLEEADLVTTTTLERPSRGRPPKGWRIAGSHDETTARVRRRHAVALLERAGEVAAGFGTDLSVVPEPDPVSPLEMHVALNWTPNGFHAPLFVAARQGLYRDVDATVSFTSARGSALALEWVREGRTDVAVTGSATLCRALETGVPVVPVALLYQRSMTVLYTVREAFGESFTSVEQLRNRTVAMPTGSETGLLARLFLSQAGVLDDVTVVDTEGEEQATLLDGGADVVTGMASDPPALEAEGHTVDSILVAEHFPVPGQALVTHAGTLADRPGDVQRFLAGTMAGWVTARREPQVAALAVAERSDATVEAERRRFEVAVDRFADSDATHKHGWGWQTIEDWQRLVTAFRQADAISEVS